MQPRHIANADSRKAAPTSAAITNRAGVSSPLKNSALATMPNVAPTPCANLFGGPGTIRCSFLMIDVSNGVITCVESRPSGLNVGPVKTRAMNP